MDEFQPFSEIPPFDRPMVYRIRVKAHLGDEWSDWFEGLTINREPNGESLLCGLVADQAALYGLLKKARDMGLGLISVARIDCAGEQSGECSAAELDVCTRCPLGITVYGDQGNHEKEVPAK